MNMKQVEDTQNNLSIPPIDKNVPKEVETATFALGWFWGPDSRFGSIAGVVRTRVGYAGGAKKNPTYHDLGDHAESVQIDYDPLKISYEQLLVIFWKSHDPTRPAWSRQYKHVVFYHNEKQQEIALRSRDRVEEELGREVLTEILPYSGFYRAEDYHQKYKLRHAPDLMAEFNNIYPDYDDFVNSTAAARINGYLYGYGTIENLQAEVDSYGLAAGLQEKLLGMMHKREARFKKMSVIS